MTNIKEVYVENTGGGTMIDFVVLNNGKLIAIGEGLIGVYDTVDAFYNGECSFLVKL